MESIDIKTTVNECAKGNQGSFQILYDFLVDRVFAFVCARVNDKQIAKEITQDIFVALHKSLPKFTYQSDLAFYSFVFTIARRQLAAHYKDKEKHKATDLDETANLGGEEKTELVYSVQSALETLDECSREIVVLHHWSRFTFAEIGVLINMTEGAVRLRHHRARATLASVLNS